MISKASLNHTDIKDLHGNGIKWKIQNWENELDAKIQIKEPDVENKWYSKEFQQFL